MSFSSVSAAHKQNHGDIYVNDSSGITTEIVANAFNMVKARIQAAGLTPPASNDILAVAENFYIKAELVWKGRMMGDLPSGQASPSTNDNINKSYQMFMELGNQKVDEYIASQTGIPTTGSSSNTRTNYNYQMRHYSGNHVIKKVNS